MNKKLLAVALASAFAAPAMANVTIYGAFDVGVQYKGNRGSIASGLNGHNGLGFKMSEDLGNGLTISGDAFFQFALDAGGNGAGLGSNASPTNGSAGGFNTLYSYLALSGDFGTVIAGRAGGARAGFIKQYDPFGGFGAGSALQAQSSALGNADYADNVLAWVTPEIVPGLKGLFAYTSNLVGQDYATDAARKAGPGTPLYAVAALYNQGPVSLTAAYENLTLYGGGGHRDVITGGGSYDFGVAKVMGLYQHIEGAQNGYQIGATAPLSSAATLKASYVRNRNSLGAGNGTCSKGAVGVNYDLSKRTRLYADVARQLEDAGCIYEIGSNGGTYSSASNTALDNGLDVPTQSWAGNIGIRHSF
jgi:predicted porin